MCSNNIPRCMRLYFCLAFMSPQEKIQARYRSWVKSSLLETFSPNLEVKHLKQKLLWGLQSCVLLQLYLSFGIKIFRDAEIKPQCFPLLDCSLDSCIVFFSAEGTEILDCGRFDKGEVGSCPLFKTDDHFCLFLGYEM